MYLLIFSQGESETKIGIFENLEDGRKFVKKIPGYEIKEEDGFIYEYLNLKSIPTYFEIEHKNNVVPISKYMFLEEEEIEIIWEEIFNLSKEGKGIIDSTTRVDAYFIENVELKEYIKEREEKYLEVKKILEEKEFQVTRGCFGSEDGEAIFYKDKKEKEWHFLTHMDPIFVNEFNIEDIDDLF